MERKRGVLTSEENRKLILSLVDEALNNRASLKNICITLEIPKRTIQRWKKDSNLIDQRTVVEKKPQNKLTEEETNLIIKTANSSAFQNLSPSQIVPKLADEGSYIASESSFYRVLKRNGQLTHRGNSAPRINRSVKAVKATEPNQAYTWDITYLKSFVLGRYFYLYFFLDIFSRKIVGWQVFEEESSENAAAVIRDICEKEKIKKEQLILHSDNGSPMKGTLMISMLQKLGVTASFSRPGVSNDNPYSESLFKTLKYHSKFPEKGFETKEDARNWVAGFVSHYNEHHLHSGIKYVTANQRHERRDFAILENRKKVYQEAREKKALRWSRNIRNWNFIKEVTLNPEKCKNDRDICRRAG